MIRTLYAGRTRPHEQGLTGDTAVSLRRTRAADPRRLRPVAGGQHRPPCPKACRPGVGYARNQWPSLVRYRDDARLAIDNGPPSRRSAPLRSVAATGCCRRDRGLSTAAVLLSLCASAKRHRLNPWSYLSHLLTECPTGRKRWTDLLPDVWPKPAAA